MSPEEIYLKELSNTLNIQIIPFNPNNLKLSALPNKRRLRESLNQSAPVLSDRDSITIREFLSIKECNLQQVIAEKNNSLGKIATKSQSLLNSLAFIRDAPKCIEKLNQKNKITLAEKLKRNLEHKKIILPYELWNALFNQEENRKFWSKPTKSFIAADKSIDQINTDEINTLIEFSKAALIHQDTSQFKLEHSLSQLRLANGGHILEEYVGLSNSLERANMMINQAKKRPFCHTGHTNPKAHFFRNVVNKRFISDIQSKANTLNNAMTKSINQMQQLEQLFSAYEPIEFKEWRETRDKKITTLQNSSKEHVLHIQSLLKQCNLAPN